MRTRHLPRALGALLGGALFAVVLAASASPLAAPLGPDYALHTDVSRVGATAGNQAVFQTWVTAAQSLSGPVALSVTGAPTPSTVSVQPGQIEPGTRAVVSVLVGATAHP